jgi:hypothetical protein
MNWWAVASDTYLRGPYRSWTMARRRGRVMEQAGHVVVCIRRTEEWEPSAGYQPWSTTAARRVA